MSNTKVYEKKKENTIVSICDSNLPQLHLQCYTFELKKTLFVSINLASTCVYTNINKNVQINNLQR
jgi:hypothetical protein